MPGELDFDGHVLTIRPLLIPPTASFNSSSGKGVLAAICSRCFLISSLILKVTLPALLSPTPTLAKIRRMVLFLPQGLFIFFDFIAHGWLLKFAFKEAGVGVFTAVSVGRGVNTFHVPAYSPDRVNRD